MKVNTLKSWMTAQFSAIALFAVVFTINLVLLLLITINGRGLQSDRSITGCLLISGAMLFNVGGYLFTGRAFLKWPVGETTRFLYWERGFVIAAVLVNTLGLALLESLLHEAGEPVLARIGMVVFVIGAIVVVIAETTFLGKREWDYVQVVVYVILAFLAEAVFGAAIIRTGLVASWIGWATIVWNLAWLVVLPITRQRDIYFPVLHHVAPVLIGITLLMQA